MRSDRSAAGTPEPERPDPHPAPPRPAEPPPRVPATATTAPEADQGGDEVCWLSRVCDACGRLTEGRAARRCEACGEPLPAP